MKRGQLSSSLRDQWKPIKVNLFDAAQKEKLEKEKEVEAKKVLKNLANSKSEENFDVDGA